MASVIRRVRRTRVKLEHGYDTHHWHRHGSMAPDAVRNRALYPVVLPPAWSPKPPPPVFKSEDFDAPQPEGPRDAAELVDAYPAH